jgi:flagellin
LTNAGTNTFTVTAGSTAVTENDISDYIDVDAGADIEYGSYTLTVTDFSSVSGTANFELTGPDGKKTEISGHEVEAALTIGGIKVALNNEAVTGNGTVKFDLTANGLEIALSGDNTASTGVITAYSGGTLNVGGFEFTVTTGKGASGSYANYTVINKAVKFHIGANEDQNTQLAINNMSAQALGVDSLILTTQEGANASIKTIDGAIEKVSAERSKLGALQNRLEHTISNLGTSAENLQAAESRIRDLDMAEEIMAFTKNNILQQAATAMLAQANMAPQSVLQLLG